MSEYSTEWAPVAGPGSKLWKAGKFERALKQIRLYGEYIDLVYLTEDYFDADSPSPAVPRLFAVPLAEVPDTLREISESGASPVVLVRDQAMMYLRRAT